MYQEYKVLPIAPKVFKVLAWIGAALGVTSALIILIGMGIPETPRWMGWLVTLVGGAVYFFIFTVVSEVVTLLLDMNAKIK